MRGQQVPVVGSEAQLGAVAAVGLLELATQGDRPHVPYLYGLLGSVLQGQHR